MLKYGNQNRVGQEGGNSIFARVTFFRIFPHKLYKLKKELAEKLMMSPYELVRNGEKLMIKPRGDRKNTSITQKADGLFCNSSCILGRGRNFFDNPRMLCKI